MAKSHITAARGAGKPAFDRRAVFIAAHTAARRRMLPTSIFSYSLEWCRARRLYIQPLSYRTVFAQELRKSWLNVRPVAGQPDRVLTAAEAAEVAFLRYIASIEPLNRAGAIAFRAAYAKADAITAAANQRAIAA
jgi:hypothetical protein